MQTNDLSEAVPIISYWWDEDDEGAEPTSIDLEISVPDGSTITATKADMADVSTGSVADTWQYMLTGTVEGAYPYTIEGVVDGRTLISSGVVLFGAGSASPGPCALWCDWGDVLDTCGGDTEGLDDEDLIPQGVRTAILERVTWVLYMLDGGRYPGICVTTRDLCRGCRRVHGRCCCADGDMVDLRGRFPVFDVWDVTIDGVVIDRSLYRVRDSRYLQRTDGEQWPACIDWSATWAFGRNPPVGLKYAAAVFSREIGRSCLDQECALPERVTTVSREGVTYVVMDSQKFIDEGRTGIYDVDLALVAARPPKEPFRSSPGGGSPLKRTTSHRSI